MDEHIEDHTLYMPDVDPIVVERSVVHHVTNDFIDDGTISSFSSDFKETYALFLQFGNKFNNVEGSSSKVLNPFRLLGNVNSLNSWSWIVCCLRWADVGREYIEVVKGALQRFFVLDFNDQAMNRFVEHQMLTSFKEFRGNCHRHFKKYSDPKQARANPPHILVRRLED
ncbi:CACTA en-spm transposon protein [Cucumis melo var. makuwa]|uniref:CACTA en-spm transposon protein n=1 Tax=Cucumis melo var. makuwa TaxID=1194695 RepID=A0A5A7UHN6_CUCMM|nr:CACTA en-spm transposon protein [Cucumis melo var. makuwa]TYK00147.1 CACTA en-spm transposon protein [Cucumis melo var. makuwa]